MSTQIIIQPDGRLAVWSTITEDLILYDATEDEVISWFGKIAQVDAEARATEIIEKLRAGKKSYYQFTKTWDEVSDTSR